MPTRGFGTIEDTTAIRRNPPDYHGEYERPIKPLAANIETYDAAYPELRERTVAEWSMLFIKEPVDP